MKTTARAFKTGDTGPVGSKTCSVYSNSKLKPSFRRKGGASKTTIYFPVSCVVAEKGQNYEMSSSFANNWHLLGGGSG